MPVNTSQRAAVMKAMTTKNTILPMKSPMRALALGMSERMQGSMGLSSLSSRGL